MALRPDRRFLLSKAVSDELFPVLGELGFESPQSGVEDSKNNGTLADRFTRGRAGFTDEIFFRWDQSGRPAFVIEFSTTDERRILALKEWTSETAFFINTGRAYAARKSLLHRWLDTEPRWFRYPRLFRGRLSNEIASAKTRLYEINRFLRDGEISGYMWM